MAESKLSRISFTPPPASPTNKLSPIPTGLKKKTPFVIGVAGGTASGKVKWLDSMIYV